MLNSELDYGAISIDTSIFDNYGIALDNELFLQLEQFYHSPVKVIITDIVDSELRKHLVRKIESARTELQKGLRSSEKQHLLPSDDLEKISEVLSASHTDVEVANKRLDKFYSKVGAEVVYSQNFVEVMELTRLYFDEKPPFESVKNKKNEFPDAIALLTLEGWAKEKGVNVLVVSSDNGWEKFSKTSEVIDHKGDLSSAIAHFQPHNMVQQIIRDLSLDKTFGVKNLIFSRIEEALTGCIESAEIVIEASSHYYYEEEEVYATYKSHELIPNEGTQFPFNVIRVEADAIVLQVTAVVTYEAYGEFSLSIYDSVDKDYIGAGGTSSTVEEEYETEILVHLGGDFSSGLESVEIARIEVIEKVLYVNFGELEIDRGYDD